MNDCAGLVEGGLAWDSVRLDLRHVLEKVLEGALSRDLQASKDSKGRDPAVSYGDVQLQRHLERFTQLVALVPKAATCTIGRICLQLFVSVLYSGLPWGLWLDTQREYLSTAIHGVNWTTVLASGWPLLEVLGIIAELHSSTQEEPDNGCGGESYAWVQAAKSPSPAVWSMLRKPPCAFAGAVAAAAIAITDPSYIDQAQLSLSDAVGNSSHLYLMVPPLPSLLVKMASVHGRNGFSLEKMHVDVVYCGHLPIGKDLSEICQGAAACHVHSRFTDSKLQTLEQCYEHYRWSASTVERPMPASTVVVSPLTWQWTEELGWDLRQLLTQHSKWWHEIACAGLPVVNRSRNWVWPVRRVRQGWWKMAYEEYATGHETAPYLPLAQFWGVGDTTSGTRICRTPTLQSLEADLARQESEFPAVLPRGEEPLEAPKSVSEWLFALDLLSQRRSLKAYTHLNGASFEEDYKAEVALSPRLARSFHIEAARFLPRGPQQRSCLFRSSGEAAKFTRDHGVVVSWCTRQKLHSMFQAVGRWWLGLNPRAHIIVPVSASVLNIFRSGDVELFPWDADIDANFIANYPIVVGSFLEAHREQLLRLGFTYTIRTDRAVFSDLEDTARMDIWISGPQDIQGYDIRARLCGVRVNFFRQQLEGTVWYYAPGEKVFGNTKGRLLHCRWPGHPACLPDCVRGGLGVGEDGCEFPSSFVHLYT